MAPRPRQRVPGPGTHDVPTAFPGKSPASHISNAPTFSMPSSRYDGAPRADKCGPAQYVTKIEATRSNIPCFTFSQQKRLLNEPPKSVVEAPSTTLDQVDGHSFHRSPRYGFGSGRRFGNDPLHKPAPGPGPGAFETTSPSSPDKARMPVYSMSSPRREPFSETPNKSGGPEVLLGSPGPGAYEGEAWRRFGPGASKSHKFSTSKRAASEAAPAEPKSGTAPGPGQYSTEVTRNGNGGLGTSTSFSMRARPEVSFERPFY
eukprot:TRINITY_DN25903_c0_g1_i1.p1 TRINITY_DN25903_c0_g1~~TRINITY_DN25903_c0_g1_i1.p1  ORF type:complete len:260 (+),score=31.25 TRINITY_DN25903_c0_g1_i1:67-846(+)